MSLNRLATRAGLVAALGLAVVAGLGTMPATTLAQADDGARHRIEGTVVGPDGEPIAGMQVNATLTEPWGLTFMAETGADGRFGVDVGPLHPR